MNSDFVQSSLDVLPDLVPLGLDQRPLVLLLELFQGVLVDHDPARGEGRRVELLRLLRFLALERETRM